MWFEVDGQALLVDASGGNLQPVLEAIPLSLCRTEPHLRALGTLILRTCSPAHLDAHAWATSAGVGQRLRLPAVAGSGVAGEALIRPTEAVLSFPGHGVATVSSDGTRAEVLIADPGGLLAAALAAAAVLAMIAEHGFSPVHASLVDHQGAGVMFCGERSRGKTCSCLALARGGWTVRADDRCFLRVRDGLPVVWGPGGDLRLRSDASRLWPDLTGPMAQGRGRGAKRFVPAAALECHAAAGSVVRPVLMFPEVGGSGRHRVERMAPAEALGELLFSTGLALLPAHAARQFRDLTVLLQQSPCYRLRLGQDMDELPRTIAEVL